jgi:hypothetical protein
VKIASMIDEHTRCLLLHLVERSITAERLVDELEQVFAAACGRRRWAKPAAHLCNRYCAMLVAYLVHTDNG